MTVVFDGINKSRHPEETAKRPSRRTHSLSPMPSSINSPALLQGLQVIQLGDGLAAAVCGRLFADVGADVGVIDADGSTSLVQHLNDRKAGVTRDAIAGADLIIC